MGKRLPEKTIVPICKIQTKGAMAQINNMIKPKVIGANK